MKGGVASRSSPTDDVFFQVYSSQKARLILKKKHLRTKSKRTLVHGRGVHGEGRGLYAHVNQIDLLFFLFYLFLFLN